MLRKRLSGIGFDAIENLVERTSTIIRDVLHLKLAAKITRLGSFQIYIVLGQQMITVNTKKSSNITIAVSHLASGEPIKFLKSS